MSRAEGFDAPESAFFDDQSNLVFVSSMGNGGDPLMKNGAGTLSVMRPNGTLFEGGKDWFRGLNSPKGVFVFHNRILVAEKDSITVIEFTQQAPGSFPILLDSFRLPVSTASGPAQLLNDLVVVAPGYVFVTDTFGNKIYRVTGLFQPHRKGAPPSVAIDDFVSGLHLLSPNGITFDGARLWVVGTDTFTGYGNFTTPIRNERGEEVVPADPEKPLPRIHPSINPTVSLAALAVSLRANPDIVNAPADPLNPAPIADRKVGDPRIRAINPVNSFNRPHHAKLYSVDLETRAVTILPSPDGGFDGIAMDGGRIIVGEFGLGKLMSVRLLERRMPEVQDLLPVERSRVCQIPGFCSNPADFSINARTRVIYVPNNTGGDVQTFTLD